MSINPHRDPTRAASARPCAGIDTPRLDNIGASITYNTYIDQYVLFGLSGEYSPSERDNVWGVFYSFSNDLLHWTPKRLLIECELTGTWQPGDPNAYAYPSLLDPDSTSRNFETADKTAYLYLTRFNAGGPHADRDLVRIPVEFFTSTTDAIAASVPFTP
jgi:hypothetical protein